MWNESNERINRKSCLHAPTIDVQRVVESDDAKSEVKKSESFKSDYVRETSEYVIKIECGVGGSARVCVCVCHCHIIDTR